MSATTFSEAGGRRGLPDRLSERWALRTWALPAILLLAGLNFFWQLGSSSYFIDEAFSVIHSLPSFGDLFHVVAHTETTPWAYFLFMHQWLATTGSQTEWVARLPSAVAGVALVWSVYWMARAFTEDRVALGAAALCAVSPLILSYAQEARVYVFLMLVLVISVGATVRASQRTKGRIRLLTFGALTAILAIWLHYTALSVILPLAAWVGTRSTFTPRQRLAFIAACLFGVGTVMPVLLEQYHYFPNGGAIAGALNGRNIVSVAGTPFAARVGTPVDLRTIAAAVVTIGAVLVVLLRPRIRVVERGLLVVLAVLGVLVLVALDLTGKHILITRYTTITAPFLLTVIAIACAELPRPAAGALAAAVLAVAIAGLVDDHRRSGFYAPADDVIEYIAPAHRAGDFLLSPGIPLTDTPIFYYDTRRLRPKLHMLGLHDPAVPVIFRRHRRVWLVDNPRSATRAATLRIVAPLLHRYHFHVAETRTFSSSIALGVVLAERGR